MKIAEDKGVDAAMTAAYTTLKGLDVVARDVFFQGGDAGLKEAWLQLMVLAQLKVDCKRDTPVAVSTCTYTMDQLLRSLNVYISTSSDSAGEGTFNVVMMRFIQQFVRDNYGDKDFRVPLFLGDSGGAGLDAADVLERLVEHRIIVEACLAGRDVTWKSLMSPMLDDSAHGDDFVVLDRHAPLRMMPSANSTVKERLGDNVTEEDVLRMLMIHPDDLTRVVVEILRSGCFWRPRAQSKSADTIGKQQRFTLELQQKSGMTAGLTFGDLLAET